MVVTNGATLKWGWVYVAARAAYPVMVSIVLQCMLAHQRRQRDAEMVVLQNKGCSTA
jgi:hypothetical protein